MHTFDSGQIGTLPADGTMRISLERDALWAPEPGKTIAGFFYSDFGHTGLQKTTFIAAPTPRQTQAPPDRPG